MRYRLFLYRPAAESAFAPVIETINSAIIANSEYNWENKIAADNLKDFDVKNVISSMDSVFPEFDCSKYKVRVCLPPKQYKQNAFLYIITSYEKAGEVLPKLYAIASENDLALFDAETGKTFYRDLVDQAFITMRLRQQRLHNEIMKKMEPVWKIKKISPDKNDWNKRCDYVVTIRKSKDASFMERVQDFYRCLSESLSENEELCCEDYCYKIIGKGYQITYTFEGYKRNADQIGYNDGCTKFLNRMSTEKAFKWLENCSDTEVSDIFSRMDFKEMKHAYPNPADRFVASVNITKWQRKQIFSIYYSGIGYYGSEILFHIVPDWYYKDEGEISVLKIEEESASFILPFVNDIYPDFYQHYYLDENHLSMEMWERIISRIKEAKEMILHDTFNSKLIPYIKRFNLFALAQSDSEYEMIRTDEQKFLHEHRYDVAELYDVFIRWSEAQLNFYWFDGRLFNIQGP